MSIEKKLDTILENEQKVYDAGYKKGKADYIDNGSYEQGYEAGKTHGYNEGYADGYEKGKAEGGGGNLIGFVFDEWGTTQVLFAEEGMTWGEWCESKYNTIDAYVNSDQGNRIYVGINFMSDTNYNELTAEKVIVANVTVGYYY